MGVRIIYCIIYSDSNGMQWNPYIVSYPSIERFLFQSMEISEYIVFLYILFYMVHYNMYCISYVHATFSLLQW